MLVYRWNGNRYILHVSYSYHTRQSIFLLWLSRCGYTYFRRWYLGDFYWFIFYPLYYFWRGKIEITAIISLVVSVAVIVGISLLINVFIGGNVSDTTYYISLIVIAIITCFTFVCSYFYQHLFFVQKSFSFMTKGKGNL